MTPFQSGESPEIEELRLRLSKLSTLALCEYASELLAPDPILTIIEHGLSSPMRQVFYLLGIGLSTPEGVEEHLSDRERREIPRLLNAISEAYIDNFAKKDLDNHKAHVAATRFIESWMQGRFVFAQQVAGLVRALGEPFSAELRDKLGFDASDAIEMLDWAATTLQARLEPLNAQLAILHEEPGAAPGAELMNDYGEALRKHSKLDRRELTARFGGKADALLSHLGIARGAVHLTWFSEPNPFEHRPIVMAGDDLIFPQMNQLYNALESLIVRTLAGKEFYRHRGRVLERRVEHCMHQIFSGNAFIGTRVFERPGTDERDVIIFWNGILVAVEAKSSPARFVLFDPERSFVRIYDEFRNEDTGIQGAYEQAQGFLDRVAASGTPVKLFDAGDNVVLTIDPTSIRKKYAIVVTADDYGTLSTDLTLLLDTGESRPVPWVVNIDSLETFVNGLRRRGFGPTEFIKYLDQRPHYHAKLLTNDELQIAGAFLIDGTLSSFHPAAKYVLAGGVTANIFDDIYYEEQGFGKVDFDRYRHLPRPLPINDDVEMIQKVGRNELCPCASGRKYKRCHGA